jgi:hypothetical protein
MHRADVDDAAATQFDHLLGRDLRAEEGALEIYRHYPFILILGGVEDRGAGFDPCVVHHDVDPTELAHSLVDEHLQVGELADIGFDANRLITDLLTSRSSASGRLWMANIVDDEIGMLPGEFENNCPAYPAVTTLPPVTISTLPFNDIVDPLRCYPETPSVAGNHRLTPIHRAAPLPWVRGPRRPRLWEPE